MKVRAMAVAAEGSNAVGTVELECTPHGLVLSYLGVGSFTEGYAPGALTTGTRVTVPWWAIGTARIEGDYLVLGFDAKFTPHHRMTLGQFSTGDATHPNELRKQRSIVQLAALGAAVVVVLAAAVTLPRFAPRLAGGAAVGIGVLTAALILFVGLVADRRLALGVEGDPAREMFLFDLGNYLPTLTRSEQGPRPPPKPLSLPLFQGFLPRTTLGVVLCLTASGLSALLLGQWIVEGGRGLRERQRVQAQEDAEKDREDAELARAEVRRPPAARPAAAPEPRPAAAPAAPSPPATPPPAAGACRCERGDSALWREAIPRLSTLVISSRVQVKRHPEMQLELAAVNNGDEDIRDLELHVDFFERDPPPQSKRHHVDHRVVYFAGPLTPGQAIKWSIEADGSEFEVKNPVSGDIGPGGDGAAPVSRFAELLDANHRPVRLHGAMMLAYLGDPRAREAALKLRDALREDEATYLRRVLQAVGDVRACQLRVPETGAVRRVEACVYNASSEAKRDLAVRVRAFEAPVDHLRPTADPPSLVAETTLRAPGELGPNQGVRLVGQIDLSGAAVPPAAFEAHGDRVDLLD